MMHAIRLVVASFARHAATDAVLVVKEHPLDNGVIDWRGVTEAAARDAGIAGRVVLVEDCDLQVLLDRTLGLVTVNSTSATFALASGGGGSAPPAHGDRGTAGGCRGGEFSRDGRGAGGISAGWAGGACGAAGSGGAPHLRAGGEDVAG